MLKKLPALATTALIAAGLIAGPTAAGTATADDSTTNPLRPRLGSGVYIPGDSAHRGGVVRQLARRQDGRDRHVAGPQQLERRHQLHLAVRPLEERPADPRPRPPAVPGERRRLVERLRERRVQPAVAPVRHARSRTTASPSARSSASAGSSTATGTPGPPRTRPSSPPAGGRSSARAESTAPALRWDWNTNRGPSQLGIDSRNAYPGDAYVDIVGVDSYDGWPGVKSEADWNEHLNGSYGLKFWADFARQHGKKFSVRSGASTRAPRGPATTVATTRSTSARCSASSSRRRTTSPTRRTSTSPPRTTPAPST